jgi:hypothetical protein
LGVVVLQLNQQDQARQALKAIDYRLTDIFGPARPANPRFS